MPRNATEIGQRRHYEFRGKLYPSVTTILKAWPAEWMIAYGAKRTALRAVEQFPEFVSRLWEDREAATKWLKAAPHERRDAAADSGTDLHAYLEDRARGADPKLLRSAGELAVDNFLDLYHPEFLFIESQVFSIADGWAGSCDAFVRIYGQVYVMDLKTSPTATTDHKARLQLAAYAHGDFIGEDDREVAPVPICDGGLILSIPRDEATFQLIRTPAGIDEYNVFLATKRLWTFYDQHKDTSIGELVLPQVEGVA